MFWEAPRRGRARAEAPAHLAYAVPRNALRGKLLAQLSFVAWQSVIWPSLLESESLPKASQTYVPAPPLQGHLLMRSRSLNNNSGSINPNTPKRYCMA